MAKMDCLTMLFDWLDQSSIARQRVVGHALNSEFACAFLDKSIPFLAFYICLPIA